MSSAFDYDYPFPLEGYENLEPLSDERNEDGKSLKNPQHGKLSKAYEEFPDPLSKDRRGGFDIHIYYFQNNPDQTAYAKALHERIRRECKCSSPNTELLMSTFWGTEMPDNKCDQLTDTIGTVPELRIYTFWDRPIGPHPVAMFEVNVFTPAQFGAFIPWLVINRGPLSALLHPNTLVETALEDERNHTQRATWLGDKIPLDLRVFKLMRAKEKEEEEKHGKL